MLNLSIAIGTVTGLAFLFLWNELADAIISFCSGFAGMLTTVATHTLAVDYSPHVLKASLSQSSRRSSILLPCFPII
jgi:hypothetical protein